MGVRRQTREFERIPTIAEYVSCLYEKMGKKTLGSHYEDSSTR